MTTVQRFLSSVSSCFTGPTELFLMMPAMSLLLQSPNPTASPLLFGLFIDDIETMLKDAQEEIDAPKLLQNLVAILLFADNIALMSYSPQGLQNQLNTLQKFCINRCLEVNVSKTKIIVCQPKHTSCPDFTFDGQLVEQRVTTFKYLGITFHATRGLTCAMEHLCNSAKKALFGLCVYMAGAMNSRLIAHPSNVSCSTFWCARSY